MVWRRDETGIWFSFYLYLNAEKGPQYNNSLIYSQAVPLRHECGEHKVHHLVHVRRVQLRAILQARSGRRRQTVEVDVLQPGVEVKIGDGH